MRTSLLHQLKQINPEEILKQTKISNYNLSSILSSHVFELKLSFKLGLTFKELRYNCFRKFSDKFSMFFLHGKHVTERFPSDSARLRDPKQRASAPRLLRYRADIADGRSLVSTCAAEAARRQQTRAIILHGMVFFGGNIEI